MQLALVELESTPLDHSGKLSLNLWAKQGPRSKNLRAPNRPEPLAQSTGITSKTKASVAARGAQEHEVEH